MKTSSWLVLCALIVGGATVLLADPAPSSPPAMRPPEAICVLTPTEGNRVTGTISLLQEGNDVHIAGEVRHLQPGEHGFHIHEYGDLRLADGSSTGGHYNPTHDEHGGLDTPHRHLGDLGNIKADANGIALIDKMAPNLKIMEIMGRSLVVHADRDDLHTQPSGNSGPRIVVGVIGYRRVDH